MKSHKQFIYDRDILQSSYLCQMCEYACLQATGINKTYKLKFPTNPHHLVETNACDSNSNHALWVNARNNESVNDTNDNNETDEDKKHEKRNRSKMIHLRTMRWRMSPLTQ